ncbi:MAG: hypothetical protein J6T67_11305 [Paludibacteraceae bacterium]|nr:hypothetical protein [Paludibacteraceae bacterium]
MTVFLIIFLTSFLCFASVVLTIVGGVKNMNKLLYGGIAGMIVFGCATLLITSFSMSQIVGNINAGYEAEDEEGRIINGIRVIGLPDDSDSEIDDRIRLDTTAVMEGININYYESNVLGESVFIFLEFHRNFDGELTLYACDENGKRLASVKESVHAKAWDSGMHNFDFGKDFDSERSKYFSLCAEEVREP